MPPAFKKILCPVDLDENATAAINLAGQIARENEAEVVVLHVVPVTIAPEEAPQYAGLYKPKADAAEEEIAALTRKHLRDIRSEVRAEIGHPAEVIVRVAKSLPADMIVMTTHRRGLSRFLLGSIAERVMREVQCPVMTAKNPRLEPLAVGQWMTPRPLTVAPGEPLAAARSRMEEGGFRSVPVVSAGKLVGIVTDRDVRSSLSGSESLKVSDVMTADVITVTPRTSILDASRLLCDRKIGALPVIEGGQVVGIISSEDLLKALTALH
ncbi:MAG: universal stress protein [Candidatus Binataceae bacterium]